MTLGRVYVDAITGWGRAAILLLVAMVPFGFLSPVLPLPAEILVAVGLAGFGAVILLFGIDRAVIETSGLGDAEWENATPDEQSRDRDGTRSITVSAMALAAFLCLGGGALVALGVFVAMAG